MPLDPQNTAQIRDRELRVWDLLLKGIEGVEIARREGVHPSVISRIKTRVEARITAETEGKVASLRARQLGEIRRARREAWRGWEASCQPAAKTTRRSGGTSRPGLVEANEIKGQNGNPAFLEKVYDGIRLEAKLTGTEAPYKQTIDGDLRLEADLLDRLDRCKRRSAEAAKSLQPVLED
jgi:DNA-binding CsgD family transcriptional regulator